MRNTISRSQTLSPYMLGVGPLSTFAALFHETTKTDQAEDF